MRATLKLSIKRFAEMLRGNHQAPKRGNRLPVIRDPYKFVERFRDFWTELKADAYLSGEVDRLSDEHLRRMVENQQWRGKRGSLPFIPISRETGCVFLRQTAGEYDDREANDFRTVCLEWSADPLLSVEDRQWAADQAAATTELRLLDDAVFAACRNNKVFPHLFESMLAALDWLVVIDIDLERLKAEMKSAEVEALKLHDPLPPADSSSGGTPVDDADDAPQKGTIRAVQYLIGWPEILDRIGQPDEAKDRIAQFNRDYPGPIITRQGAAPKVDAVELVGWWNGLKDRWREESALANDVAPELETYQHGRTETVVPEIGGHETTRVKGRNAK